MLEIIANALKALAGWLGYAQQRDAEKNTPAVQAGKVAAEEQAARDKTATALAKKDLKEIRNEAAE